jgi:hypothetical protein
MNLLHYNPVSFYQDAIATGTINDPNINAFFSIYKLIHFPTGISLIDRSGKVTFPIETILTPENKIPVYTDSNLTYKECCLKKAQEIVDIHNATGYSINLMYSGGIDSSVMLAAFIELLGIEESTKKIKIILSNESIIENPEFWSKFIRPNFVLVNSLTYRPDETSITVLAELNDQLFGSDIVKSIYSYGGNKAVNSPATFGNLYDFLDKQTEMSDYSKEIWVNLLLTNLNTCPVSDKKLWDVFWWYNFVFKWTNVKYRYAMYTDVLYSPEIIKNNIINFFDSVDFQLWSMNNKEPKHLGTIESYKHTAKQIFVDITGLTDYIKKVKKVSLENLLTFKQHQQALTSDFHYLNNLTFENVLNTEYNFYKQ